MSSEDTGRQSALGYAQDTAAVTAVVSSFPCSYCLAAAAGKAAHALQATPPGLLGAGTISLFLH